MYINSRSLPYFEYHPLFTTSTPILYESLDGVSATLPVAKDGMHQRQKTQLVHKAHKHSKSASTGIQMLYREKTGGMSLCLVGKGIPRFLNSAHHGRFAVQLCLGFNGASASMALKKKHIPRMSELSHMVLTSQSRKEKEEYKVLGPWQWLDLIG